MDEIVQEPRRKPRLILVEGPDGAGKTTLVDLIEKAHPGLYRSSCGVPERPPLKEYMHKSIEAWYERVPVVVFDRFHLGEQVYGPIMRGKDKLGIVGQDVLEYFLKELFDPVVVLARPPFDACREAWSGRLEREYVPDEDRMFKVWESFGRLHTHLPILDYDRTSSNVERLMKRLIP